MSDPYSLELIYSLPKHVKYLNNTISFCNHLKTHHFRLAYLSFFASSDHLLMNFALYLDYEIARALY